MDLRILHFAKEGRGLQNLSIFRYSPSLYLNYKYILIIMYIYRIKIL